MRRNKPIFLAGRKFDYICDININKNSNALRISRFNSFRLHAFDISTHDGDEFCRFRIPPLFHWSLEQIRGVYIICQPTPETVLYLGQTNHLPGRFNRPGGHGNPRRGQDNSTGQINKQIYAKIEAGNLLKIYFHNVSDESKRKKMEADLIHNLNPCWNKQGRSDRNMTDTHNDAVDDFSDPTFGED